MTAVQASHKAKESLRPYTVHTAVITTVLCILAMLLAVTGSIIERSLDGVGMTHKELHVEDGLLLLLPALGILITSVFRNGTDRWIGETTGILTVCDLGFLDCSSRLWLWRKRVGVSLLANALLIVSCLPSLLLAMGALATLHLSASTADGTLHLLLPVHLLMGAVLLMMLPIRLYFAAAALPLCYLKQPHRSAFTVWRYTLYCTKGICGKLLYNRLRFAVSLLIPFRWFSAYPAMLAAEMLLCDSNRQKILPDL